ncbi:protein singed wings 2 [Folsomia candida]|uniref:protein singed wings 2 n=1 Tax=Folsomia candida TaxID=158441 RepID=UPI000B8F9943|nr:protein singed wings 2 [Folsomia candida]
MATFERVGAHAVVVTLLLFQVCASLSPVQTGVDDTGSTFPLNSSFIKIGNESSHLLFGVDRDKIRTPFGRRCLVDESETGIICADLSSHQDPFYKPLPTIRFAELVNCSLNLARLKAIFPKVVTLVLTHSLQLNNGGEDVGTWHESNGRMFDGTWSSVRFLNISWNSLSSAPVSDLLPLFPSLEVVDLSHNFVNQVELDLGQFQALRWVDISGNPLNCSAPMEWLDAGRITLLHAERTLCDLPPHQNRAKPIWKVRKLIKKVRDQCRGNCSCDITYIWEQNHIIHSKITVNCSGRGFIDFPDPATLPNPTDTLDLSNNEITSMRRFVEDDRFEALDVMNLHMDSNHLKSIALLETSNWFYNFQIFTFRNNSVSEVPVYVLENVFSHNKRILQVDLSLNPFHCDCTTLSTLKIWLLKHAANIKHIEDVRCLQGGSQIRYMRHEMWCTVEEVGEAGLVDIFDMISFFLVLAIFLVVAKVYYDYWNLKHNGKLPWVATKM